MKDRKRRRLLMLLCFLMCGVCIFGYILTSQSAHPSQNYAKSYIMENHNQQTGAANAVTAIYLNYRLWDTLFEAMVLMLSALAVISFSWSMNNEE